MKKLLILVIIVIAAGVIFFLSQDKRVEAPVTRDTGSGSVTFDNPKKSAHYESNTPAHGAVLPGVPFNVVVDFNFDLAEGSSITITNLQDGQDYGTAETVIDGNSLTMRREMDPQAPDGLYQVDYNACWPDGSCHDGYFQFHVERALAEEATDLRGQGEVEINMENIAFAPEIVRISRGTKVVWNNHDEVGHFVNTDSHPAHTFYLPQNSRELAQDDTFEVVFDRPGVYPYHCSAHAGTMTGMIIVE